MDHRIEHFQEKKLIGKRLIMSLSDNKTHELWKSFMQNRKEIKSPIGSDLYSMQIYKHAPDSFSFNPEIKFEKWAAIEVKDFSDTPKGMESFSLKSGLYAVFIHKGAAQEFAKTFQYIFGDWLPKSSYLIDDRPHFEILGTKYKNNSPDSEEEVWIPIKLKK